MVQNKVELDLLEAHAGVAIKDGTGDRRARRTGLLVGVQLPLRDHRLALGREPARLGHEWQDGLKNLCAVDQFLPTLAAHRIF